MMAVLLVTADCQVVTVPQQAAKLYGVGLGIGRRIGRNRIILPPLSAGNEPVYPFIVASFIYHVVDGFIVILTQTNRAQCLGYFT